MLILRDQDRSRKITYSVDDAARDEFLNQSTDEFGSGNEIDHGDS